jgi:hypothetical protein
MSLFLQIKRGNRRNIKPEAKIRVLRSQSAGHRFDPGTLHHFSYLEAS